MNIVLGAVLFFLAVGSLLFLAFPALSSGNYWILLIPGVFFLSALYFFGKGARGGI